MKIIFKGGRLVSKNKSKDSKEENFDLMKYIFENLREVDKKIEKCLTPKSKDNENIEKRI